MDAGVICIYRYIDKYRLQAKKCAENRKVKEISAGGQKSSFLAANKALPPLSESQRGEKLQAPKSKLQRNLKRNASVTAAGRARLSSARRGIFEIVARRAEDRRALPAVTEKL